eukprot:scaffold287510_cov32-Tisochrysis_lutea.AAC.1
MLTDEGVRVVRLHGGEGVVHVAVVSLISINAFQSINPPSVICELPITLGDVWGRQVCPCSMELGSRGFYVRNDVVISRARRLFEISDESVPGLWVDHVHAHQKRCHGQLSCDAHRARDKASLKHAETYQ